MSGRKQPLDQDRSEVGAGIGDNADSVGLLGSMGVAREWQAVVK